MAKGLKKSLNPQVLAECQNKKISRVSSRNELYGIVYKEIFLYLVLPANEETYQAMKTVAERERMKVFVYSEIAKRSIE